MRWPSPVPGAFRAALFSRSHIRIDTVYVRVRPSVRAVLDLVSLTALRLLYRAGDLVRLGRESAVLPANSHSLSEIEAPLVIPQGLWFAGLVFFVWWRCCC